MDIGFGAPVSGAWATPRNLTEFARRAERLGYRSLWTFQRLLAPASAPLAPAYRSVLDPMVSLGFLASATSAIRLGVAVVNHPFASPLLLAKQAATVDVLSGGRVDLGIGSGWLPEEFTGSGANMARRGARAEEYVAALRSLWTGDRGYEGMFFHIPPGRQDPRPVQRPGPPILLGGMSEAAMERAGRISDGWVTASSADLSKIAEWAKVVQNAATAAGRGPARIICRGVVRPGKPAVSKKTGQRLRLSGSYEQIREDVSWLDSCGVTEVFYDLNFDPLVGDPDVDEGKALLRASEILEALAPDARVLSPGNAGRAGNAGRGGLRSTTWANHPVPDVRGPLSRYDRRLRAGAGPWDLASARAAHPAAVSASIPASTVPVTAGSASCTKPSFSSSAQYGIWNQSPYYAYNDMWGISGYSVSQTISACSYSNWYVTADMNNDNGDGHVNLLAFFQHIT